jgi:molybdate transport system ATP-binding protein
MAAPFITLNKVSVRLRDKILFEGLTWEMLDDQHWAVIGPNGSGKSTLMGALCGSLPIVKGRIVYHYAERDKSPTPEKQIAYVNYEAQRRVLGIEAYYQERWNGGLEEGALAVSEFLSENNVNGLNAFQVAEVRTDGKYAARQREVIEQLELVKLLGINVVQLSNGERRKVLIARALLKNPRLLILDNPFSGLDERFRKKLADNLDSLMRGEMRVVITGPNRDELPPRITHILELSFRARREIAGMKTRFLVARPAAQNGKGHRLRLANLDILPKDESPDSSRKIMVQMQNVNVSYTGPPVLHQVNWVVRENEQWALLGPNGAGKTTLLSLILADNPQAYANDITLFGKRRGSGESIWEIKRNIGWVAPELQLYYPRDATGFEVACSGWFDSIGLYRDCSAEQRAVAMEWLGRFGVEERADVAFENISEGEQRLVLLARAMVKDPALLVLDEPCQGLDETNRDRVLQAVDGLRRRSGASLIYVTHRADELPSGITHVLRLSEGQVVEQGPKRK